MYSIDFLPADSFLFHKIHQLTFRNAKSLFSEVYPGKFFCLQRDLILLILPIFSFMFSAYPIIFRVTDRLFHPCAGMDNTNNRTIFFYRGFDLFALGKKDNLIFCNLKDDTDNQPDFCICCRIILGFSLCWHSFHVLQSFDFESKKNLLGIKDCTKLFFLVLHSLQ